MFKSSDASAHTGGDDTNTSPSSFSASTSSAHSHNSNKSMHPNQTKGGSSTHKTSSSSSKLPHNHTSDTRPFHKVILLCGAPGTGKVSCNGNLGAFKDDREGVG